MDKGFFVRWGKRITLFIGLFLLILLISFSEPELLLEYISQINVIYFIFAVLLSLVGTAFRTERWRILVGRKEGLPFLRSLYWYFAGFFWGSLTPGRVAELYRVKWLLSRKIPFAHATASVLMDRLFDLLAMAIAAFASFALLALTGGDISYRDSSIGYGPGLVSDIELGYFVSGFILIFIALFVTLKSPLGRKFLETIWNKLKEIGKVLISYSGEVLWVSAGWTLVAMAFFLLERWILSKAVGIDVPALYIFACIFGAALLSLLPITIQGVGTRDIMFVVMLGIVEVPKEQALVFSSIILVIILLHAVLGYMATLIVRDDSKQEK